MTLFLDVGLNAPEARPLECTREGGRRVDGAASQVLRPGLAHGSVPFHRQSEDVKARMTSGASRIRAMLCQHVAQWRIRLGFVLRQLRHRWWRRRNHLAQEPTHHPIPALDWTGSQARGTLGQEHGHGKQAPAFVFSRIIDANPVVFRAGHAGNAVVAGEHRIHEGVIAIQQIEDGAIVPNHLFDEPDRLLEHRLLADRW